MTSIIGRLSCLALFCGLPHLSPRSRKICGSVDPSAREDAYSPARVMKSLSRRAAPSRAMGAAATGWREKSAGSASLHVDSVRARSCRAMQSLRVHRIGVLLDLSRRLRHQRAGCWNGGDLGRASRVVAWSKPVLSAAIGVAFLTGTLACGCVGAWGVAALATGLATSVAAAWVLARVRPLPPGANP